MRIIETEQLKPSNMHLLSRDEAEFVYNGCDCMITYEVQEHQETEGDVNTKLIYAFERSMQKPALVMMNRGISVDQKGLMELYTEYQKHARQLEAWIARLSTTIWNRPFNPRSVDQLKELLYTHMQFPAQHSFSKGEKKVSVNRECLEALVEKYLYAKPLLLAILKLRDMEKKLGVLKNSVDKSGRFRASYNIAGTVGARWSSSKNVFGGGTNAQNITHELRSIFIADPGYKLGYADLEQAESRGVAYLAPDQAYIAACSSGDLHTTVAKMVWPNLDWPGTSKGDREVADQIFYRHFTYRDMSKRGGHASNYYATAATVAKHLKIPISVAKLFQDAYFAAFPGISHWHTRVEFELKTRASLTTPLGRRRIFFGRLTEASTLREAIASSPQSMIGEILNLGLYRVWEELEKKRRVVEILGQIHDAIIFQYPEREPEVVHEVCQLMTIPVPIGNNTMTIPVEVKVGYNWKDLAKLGSPIELAQVRTPVTDKFSLLDAIHL